jgi:hypothetical protein
MSIGMTIMSPPGIEPGSQAWKAGMIPLHYRDVNIKISVTSILLKRESNLGPILERLG